MILDSIRVKNFRQYYGTQTIRFSKDREKNVTVIHGENGSGKTSLLNAFLWCFYGQINLPKPEAIISERAEGETPDGQELECSVEIKFRDENRDYTVSRSIIGKKQNGRFVVSYPVFEINYIEETGESKSAGNPQVMINQIMPDKMSSYFFFDGERIDNLSKESGADDIKEAIKTIMGLEALERAQDHLDDVRRIFATEVKKSADTKLQQLINEREALEDQEKECRRRQAETIENKKASQLQKNKVNERFRQVEETRQAQAERDRLDMQKASIQKNIADIDKKLKIVASTQGYLAFSDEITVQAHAFLEEKRSRGEVPSGIKEQFVKDLLEAGKCICGNPLVEGSDHYTTVAQWLTKATSQVMEDKVLQVSADIKNMTKYRIDLFTSLKDYMDIRAKYRKDLTSVNEQLDEIGAKLSGKDSEEIRDLERKRKELEDEIEDANKKLGRLEKEITDLQKSLLAKTKEINQCEAAESQVALAKKRMEACLDAKEAFMSLHHALASKVKNDLQNRINDVYANFMRKGYHARLNDDYMLQIIKDSGDDEKNVAMSQGERQITSLAFIGALVDLARVQGEKGQNRFFRGGIFPIVMDSPFGALDPDHRSRIADGIPTLARQVVVMVTDSQWQGEVEKELNPKVASHYYLRNFAPNTSAGVTYEFTEIREAQ